MFSVQPKARHKRYEELRAVRVWTRVGHRKHPAFRVLQRKIFVVELLSIDALAPGSISFRKIASLHHEIRDNPVQRTPLVAEAMFVRAQLKEILHRLWARYPKQSDRDPFENLRAGHDFEEDQVSDLLLTSEGGRVDRDLPQGPLH